MWNTVKIWEAARATSAATGFFDSITIRDETFVDGATGANNPIRELWAEAADVWKISPSQLEEHVKCLVSIGTGIHSLAAFVPGLHNLARAVTTIATDTEKIANDFRKHHTEMFLAGNTFRFNVVCGLENIGLEEASKWGGIKAATLQQEECRVAMKRCAENLQERGCTSFA